MYQELYLYYLNYLQISISYGKNYYPALTDKVAFQRSTVTRQRSHTGKQLKNQALVSQALKVLPLKAVMYALLRIVHSYCSMLAFGQSLMYLFFLSFFFFL
jgi:hypothetical protein